MKIISHLSLIQLIVFFSGVVSAQTLPPSVTPKTHYSFTCSRSGSEGFMEAPNPATTKDENWMEPVISQREKECNKLPSRPQKRGQIVNNYYWVPIDLIDSAIMKGMSYVSKKERSFIDTWDKEIKIYSTRAWGEWLSDTPEGIAYSQLPANKAVVDVIENANLAYLRDLLCPGLKGTVTSFDTYDSNLLKKVRDAISLKCPWSDTAKLNPLRLKRCASWDIEFSADMTRLDKLKYTGPRNPSEYRNLLEFQCPTASARRDQLLKIGAIERDDQADGRADRERWNHIQKAKANGQWWAE